MDNNKAVISINVEPMIEIGRMFGSDVSTKEGVEEIITLAVVTLLSIGKQIKEGNVLIAIPPENIPFSPGMVFNFPDPLPPLKLVKK